MTTYLVASDLSERADRAVARAFRLAARNGARLVLATVVDDSLPAEIGQRLAGDLRERLAGLAASLADGVEHEVRVVSGDPAAAIAELAGEVDAKLLILGVHRPRPLLDAVRDTTMQRIVRLGPCPVLMVRDRADQDYRTVLAAIDFSPASAAAMRAAAAVAPGARIRAVHALHVPYKGRPGTALPFRRDAELAAHAWIAAETPPAIDGGVRIVEGAPSQVIAGALASDRPDLVVAGAHSRTGLAQMVLGSVATTLMRDPPTDLLIARPHP